MTRTLSRILRFSFTMVALVAVLAASAAVITPRVVDLVSAHRSDHERISLGALAERSYIYDSRGNPQGTLINNKNENRVFVPLAEVPKTVVSSVLASEDQYFWRHKGVNVRSILRAANANLASGGVAQGGSTITQQVVKNSLVGNKQDLSRKLREAFLATELEKQIGKKGILERYLNSVYFGGGAYGVQAAAFYYFNRDVKDLGWAEGALLAALIPSPADYDPFKNPKLAQKRRHIVLGRLVVTKRLSKSQAALLDTVAMPTKANNPVPPGDYFEEQVKSQLLNDPSFGLGATQAARNQTVFSGGIRVYTTFNPDLQAKAIQARNETLPHNKGNGTFDVLNPKDNTVTYGTEAIASVEPSTGAVRVLVGGPGYDVDKSRADLTGRPGRQPGSSMKVITLAAAMENLGFVPSDTVNGGACSFRFPGKAPYRPATHGIGVSTITKMVEVSSNCGFMRLSQMVGVDKVAEMGHRLGIRTPLAGPCGGGRMCVPENITLGTESVPVLDMAAAYATFANDGLHNPAYLVERIEDSKGKVIYQHQAQPERVVSTQVARQINEILQNNVVRGTGKNAAIYNRQPAAGKTGTTNDSTDVWFVGYTPQLSTAIWMGAPAGQISLNNAGLSGATGGKFPAATWGRYYSLVLGGRPLESFTPPEPTRRGRYLGRAPFESGGGGAPSTPLGPGGTDTRPRPPITYKPPRTGGGR